MVDKKKKTREELIENLMLNKIIKFLEADDSENALHFIYALKMWKKEDFSYATQKIK